MEYPVSSITPESPFRGNRISRYAFRLVLDINAALPVIQERDASEYYDAIVATGVDPLFILAMFEHESQMGHAGVARVTHSWGNTRKPSFGAVPVGETPGASGTFPIFATWLDGCISTAARLVDPGWVYDNRTTVREIFDHPSGQVWAPAGDFNNPVAYLRAVIYFMNANSDTNSTAGVVPRPPMRTDVRAVKFGGYDTGDGMTNPKTNEAIVYHISDGVEGTPPDGTRGDLYQLTRVVSSNYYVNKAGVIRELVPPTDAAWTNGPVGNPDLANPIIKRWIDNGWNPNTRTLSIEHEGKPADTLTEAQIASTIHLTAWLCQEWALPIDRTHIIGHYQIDSVERAYCPSFSDAEWTRLLDGARAFGQQPADPNARYFPETDKWIVNDGAAMLTAWTNKGGVPVCGFPLFGMTQDDDGVYRQIFENVMLEIYPDQSVRFGGLGQRYKVLLESRQTQNEAS